jgi:hypothetical protein
MSGVKSTYKKYRKAFISLPLYIFVGRSNNPRQSNNSKSEEKEILKEAKFFLRTKSNCETASLEIK